VSSVLRHLEARVLTVTIDRPPVNALDDQLIDELRSVFRDAAKGVDVGAVVLTAAGTRAFCAGMDLVAPRDFSRVADRLEPGRRGREMLEAIRNCPVPVVAAVNGPAIGGGMSIVSMCDCIVMSTHAYISAPEIGVGLLGAFSHLADLVGPRRARHLYFSGDRCSAEELAELGAVTRLSEPDSLMAEALDIAASYAAKDLMAVRMAKEAMNRTDGLPLLTAYRLEQDYTVRLRADLGDFRGGGANQG
jgi:enoyl-CoA hydratase